jgi:hypothetical protein
VALMRARSRSAGSPMSVLLPQPLSVCGLPVTLVRARSPCRPATSPHELPPQLVSALPPTTLVDSDAQTWRLKGTTQAASTQDPSAGIMQGSVVIRTAAGGQK